MYHRLIKIMSAPFKLFVMISFIRRGIFLGYSIYSDILLKKGMSWIFSVSPTFGDTYIVGSQYKRLAERVTASCDYPVWLGYKNSSSLMEVLDINNYYEIDHNNYFNFIRFHMLTEQERVRVTHLHFQFVTQHNSILGFILGYKITNLREMFLRYNGLPVSDVERYALDEKEKIVVISPYAKSVRQLPILFWKKLTTQLLNSGYRVYSNIAIDKNGVSEQPIDGSEGIKLGFNEIIPFLNKSMAFVGLRSGLQDITESASVLNISLQEKSSKFKLFYGSKNDVYAMTKNYTRPNMYDLVYTPRTEISLIDKIVSMVEEYALEIEN